MKIKDTLVQELKSKLKNVDKLGLVYPKEQNGYIRFDNNKLHSVYLENILNKNGDNIILKFTYRDFHYVESSFIFKAIYICSDKCNEYRYNQDLQLDAIYLKDISIPAELDKEKKLHMLKVLIEWQKLSRMLGKKEYISTYQIRKFKYTGGNIKDSGDIMNPYIISTKPVKLEEQSINILEEMVDNFDKTKVKWGYKWDKKQNKKEVIYLIIDKQNTNNDG